MRKAKTHVTETGGREATTRHIPPKLALAVGMPSAQPARGWQWTKLTDIARLESGHTPSRQHPEWWGGSIPWIGIQDARANDGKCIEDTQEHTNALGIQNSSARILPTHTVCLSRTASVGYVVVMGQPMATSQDFVNWICSEKLDFNFLKYLFLAEGDDLLRFASGAVHQTIYFPEAKAFHICHPSIAEQRRIVSILGQALDGISTAIANAERNLQNTRDLFESLLNSTFADHKNGWINHEKLEDLTDPNSPITYGVVKPGDEGDVVFIRGGDLTGGRILIDQLRTITQTISKQYRRTLLRGGELLISLVGQPGQVAVAPAELAGANIARQVGLIRLSPRMNAEFVRFFLQSPIGRSALGARQSGSVQQVINLGELRQVLIPTPTLGVQADVVHNLMLFAENTYRLASIYERKIAALDELKKSLLHQAFSGAL